MGNYNPHTPVILGQEWVPIRDESIDFPVVDDPFELGYTFTLSTTAGLADARFYIPTPSPNFENGGHMVNIYPVGTEALSGPVRRVVIPVSAAAITGTGGLITPTTSALMTAAVSNPSDAVNVVFQQGSTPTTGSLQQAAFYFDTNRYATYLAGKRILALNLLYSGFMYNTGTQGPVEPSTQGFSNLTLALIQFNSGTGQTYDEFTGLLNVGFDGYYQQPISTMRLGNFTTMWQQPLTDEALPWRYADIQRFDFGAVTNRMSVVVEFHADHGQDRIQLNYLAMEVIYCEEQRIVIGGQMFRPYGLGTNVITLRDINTAVANPIVAAGQYTVTTGGGDVGQLGTSKAALLPLSPINGLRELYSFSPHMGVEIDKTITVGESFTKTQSHILPQLSITITGGTNLTDAHVYGRLANAPVYGTVTASQTIYDDSAAASSYSQVRYYARRFGNTTQSLKIQGASPGTITGSSATITVADFDALSEIIDGWREVILRLSTPATMGGLTPDPIWTWSAVGETVGNQWQILGATAPAVSGIPGNLLNLSPVQLSSATYQPPSGASVLLAWKSPAVTAVTNDATSDANVVFSQEPPIITGVTISTLSQAVTGFSECSSGPCCIPSAISYNRITWSPTTLAATGFGAYELSRYDATEAAWKIIALATNPAVTGFNDYEARVGVTSSYQLRQRNVLSFYGLYSVTGTGTVTAPGVTLPSCGTNKRGVLIFTSNASQTGAYNLAYAMTWDSDIVEDFSFPESGGVQITPHYDRDYQVAFHGTERGGEVFSRTLLTANAAVALPRLANFKSLRDMAWADLPYVCVRDDIGDRWLATVIVPGGEVRRNRRLYNADITVVEVTNTPNPVDP